MFYQIGANGVKQVEEKDIDELSITAGYITLSKLKDCYRRFGFAKATLDQCQEETRYFRSNIEVYDDYSFSTLTITEAQHPERDEDCVALYIRKNMFIVVDVFDKDMSTEKTFKAALNRFPAATLTMQKLVYAFLDGLLADDNRALEDMEFDIHKFEERVFSKETKEDFNHSMLTYKRKLLYLRNYYMGLSGVGQELINNENDLFPEDDLWYFKILKEKAEGLAQNVNLLSDSMFQLREAYQSMLDIKLNSIMKVLTLITCIFLPPTLITGWFGMNFANMPMLQWKLGVPAVFLICVVLIVVLIAFFKKKKLW